MAARSRNRAANRSPRKRTRNHPRPATASSTTGRQSRTRREGVAKSRTPCQAQAVAPGACQYQGGSEKPLGEGQFRKEGSRCAESSRCAEGEKRASGETRTRQGSREKEASAISRSKGETGGSYESEMGSRQAERRTCADGKKGRKPRLSHETTNPAFPDHRHSLHPVGLRSPTWIAVWRRARLWQRRSPDSVARPLAHLRQAYSGLRKAAYIPQPDGVCDPGPPPWNRIDTVARAVQTVFHDPDGRRFRHAMQRGRI